MAYCRKLSPRSVVKKILPASPASTVHENRLSNGVLNNYFKTTVREIYWKKIHVKKGHNVVKNYFSISYFYNSTQKNSFILGNLCWFLWKAFSVNIVCISFVIWHSKFIMDYQRSFVSVWRLRCQLLFCRSDNDKRRLRSGTASMLLMLRIYGTYIPNQKIRWNFRYFAI